LLPADPTRLRPGPRRRRRLPRVLSLGDIEAMLAAADGTEPLALRDRMILELLYGCGLRSQEVVGLRLEDVKAGQAQLIVHGKGAKTRVVPLGEEGAAAVRRYMERGRGRLLGERRREEPHLLVSKAGRPLLTSDIRRIVVKCCAMPTPRTCWRGAPIYGLFRSFWGMLPCPRHRCTPTSAERICDGSTTFIIHARERRLSA
jgi:site-specific recombinase XerD